MEVKPPQQDWTIAPGKPDPMPPQLVTRTRLLEQVLIRRAILETEDKTLADPLGHWKRVR